MVTVEIDFSLTKDKAESKVFKFTNADGTVYDMTASTAECQFYKAGPPPSSPVTITCSIDVPTGKITVPFTISHSDTLGTYEYVIEEDVGGTGTILPLVKGNIAVLDYIPFSESIEAYLRSELPANLTLTMDYRNQRIMYWRRILQAAFEISDANINVESEWPTLVNALLAKLVVYDALMLAASGSFVQFLGGDYTDTSTVGGGGVKSVETGPAKVEYYDTASSAKQAFAASAGNISMFEALKEGLCGLARYLQVKIPMCDGNKNVYIPEFHQNPDWDYPTLGDIVEDLGEVSQG